jgi:oligopeptide transport system permease protein
MLKFIIRRLLEAIPVLLIISAIAFFMVRLAPGGPFSTERNVPPEILENLNQFYGLDRPVWQQYLSYLGNALQGDLGPSYKYANWSVTDLIADAFPVSLELGCWALLIALTLGISAGVIAAARANQPADYLAMSLSMAGICIPMFVTGPLLIGIFALGLNWYNAGGWFFPRDRVLPALTLGLYYAAYVARLTRGGMLDVLTQDFIRTAHAKGLTEGRIMFRHAMKGGLLPVISFLGTAIAGLVTGSFVVETIFQVPGLGRFFVMAAFNRDYFMVCGTVLFFATLIILLNLAVDVLQVWLNPRLRFD